MLSQLLPIVTANPVLAMGVVVLVPLQVAVVAAWRRRTVTGGFLLGVPLLLTVLGAHGVHAASLDVARVLVEGGVDVMDVARTARSRGAGALALSGGGAALSALVALFPARLGLPVEARRARVLAAVTALATAGGAVVAGAGAYVGAGTGPLAALMATAAVLTARAFGAREAAATTPVADDLDLGEEDEATVVASRAELFAAPAAVRAPATGDVDRVADAPVATLLAMVALGGVGLSLAAQDGAAPAVTWLFAGASAAMALAGLAPVAVAARAAPGTGALFVLGLGPWGLSVRALDEDGLRAGAYAAAVWEVAGAGLPSGAAARDGEPFPQEAALPRRVLVADAAAPRWLQSRRGGGVETLPIADALPGDAETITLGGAGAALLDGDGLVLPASMTAVDLYLLLADARLRTLNIVRCAPFDADGRRWLSRDPLAASGRCGVTSLALKRPERPLRSVILLKEGEVDDGGDIRRVSELTGLQERGLLVRLQADATAGDLLAALPLLARAPLLALGWGVDLDGEAIPVGVRP